MIVGKSYFEYSTVGEEVKRIFYNFLKFFNPSNIYFSSKIDLLDFYQKKITIGHLSSTVFLNFEHLIQFSDELADIIEDQFIYLECYLHCSFMEFIKVNLKKNINHKQYWISIYNLRRKEKTISPKSLNKLTIISGKIIEISNYYPKLILGTFKCLNKNCKMTIWHINQKNAYMEPPFCFSCGSKNWVLSTEDSIFVFFQKLKIEKKIEQRNNEKFETFDVYLKYNFNNSLKLKKKVFFSGFFVLSLNLKKKMTHNEFFQLGKDFKEKVVDHISLVKFISFYFQAYYLYLHKENLYKKILYCRKTCIEKKFSNFELYPFFFCRKNKQRILDARTCTRFLSKFTNSFCPINSLQEELSVMLLSSFVKNKQNQHIQEFKKKSGVNIFIINQFFTKNKVMESLFSSFSQIFHENVKNFSLLPEYPKHFNSNNHERHFAICSDSFGTNVHFISNFNISKKFHFSTKKITNGCENNLFHKLNKNINSEAECSFIIFPSFSDQTTYVHDIHLLLNSLNFFNLNLCFCVLNLYPQVPIKKKIKIYNNSKKKYFRHMQQYFYFINLLEPILTKKAKNFAINLYRFLKKQDNIKSNDLNEITIVHLESLGKISEIISKFYFNLYIEEFAVKTAARILIFSINSYSYQQYNTFHSVIKQSNKFRDLTKFKKTSNKIILINAFPCIIISKNSLYYTKNIERLLKNANFSLKIAILKEAKKYIYGLETNKILIVLIKILLKIKYILPYRR
nr:minichromosome maintenance complex component 6-like [Cryptomonas paramecium]